MLTAFWYTGVGWQDLCGFLSQLVPCQQQLNMVKVSLHSLVLLRIAVRKSWDVSLYRLLSIVQNCGFWQLIRVNLLHIQERRFSISIASMTGKEYTDLPKESFATVHYSCFGVYLQQVQNSFFLTFFLHTLLSQDLWDHLAPYVCIPCPLLLSFNHFDNFHKIWYERYSIGHHAEVLLRYFLQNKNVAHYRRRNLRDGSNATVT